MVLYSFYMFNRFGDCIYSQSWARSVEQNPNEQKLVAGVIFALQTFTAALATSGNGGFRAMRTPLYKLHYKETMTGYRLAVMTDPEFPTAVAQEFLDAVFLRCFNDCVARDPSYRHEQGVTLQQFPKFASGMKQLVEQMKFV